MITADPQFRPGPAALPEESDVTPALLDVLGISN